MARKERKYHYIYKITCLKNGRYYIGMHSTDNLEDGYMGGGKRIKNSVKKHGKDAHRKEILEFFENRELLRQREIQIINEDLLNDPLCMNLQPGGGGGFINEHHKKKCLDGLSTYMKKLWKDPDYIEKSSKRSSEYMKKRHSNGLIRYDTFTGRRHSENTINKMRESKINHGKGENNSQYGTKWITDGSENRKIKAVDLIPDGWYYGRI